MQSAIIILLAVMYFDFIRFSLVARYNVFVASLACLFPGLVLPVMTIEAGAELPMFGYLELYNRTQSIWSGIVSLYDSGYWFVSFLIFLFSVMIPVLKMIALVIVLFFNHLAITPLIHKIVLVIGKWSMADVFVVGIFISFLAGQASPNMQASLHSGFYWFLAYCVLSLLAAQLIKFKKR